MHKRSQNQDGSTEPQVQLLRRALLVMARLVDAIDGNDFGQLDRYAHEMSTLGSSLGDARLTDLGHQLEDAAGTHEVEASRKLVVELREEVFRLATAAGIQSM